MIELIYNFGLLLVLLASLPKMMQAKYRKSLATRLGWHLPKLLTSDGPVIWVHAISMGETRAVIPLFNELRKTHPTAKILISNATETGHEEAKRSMPSAAAHFLLPFDFSWIMNKAVRSYKPDLLILVESDFWLNLLRAVKKRGGRVLLINGKISARSAKRFSFAQFFAKPLFSQIDRFCLQNELYKERFMSIGIPSEKCSVTGNIKLDFAPKILSQEERESEKTNLGILPSDRVVVIGSTHPTEEEKLLSALKPVWDKIPELKVILVPRHPERFSSVADYLKETGYSFMVYSRKEEKMGSERVVLIDAMGLLNKCYQLAEVAIVAGSFIDTVGGHNILEPTFVSVPVLFGPHMFSQPDLVDLALGAKVGEQVTLERLPLAVLELLQSQEKRIRAKQAASTLTASIRGATARTFAILEEYLK